MKFGIYLPNFGEAIDARTVAEVASEAETAGWDGLFLWDHILYSASQKLKMVDPWIALTAAAMTTAQLRLGTSVTPVARRRPWVLARETASLDQLSAGRLILGVGLGEPAEAEFERFGEPGDPKKRAQRLDEGLAILDGLWSGKSFKFQGTHYQLDKVRFLPRPAQMPRVPVWVGGWWPNKAPFRRAARWDGVIPIKGGGWLTPDDLKELLAFVHKQRTSSDPFDAAVIGTLPSLKQGSPKGAAKLEAYVDAGATWWLQSFFLERNDKTRLLGTVRAGPP